MCARKDRDELWENYWQERRKSLRNSQGKWGAVVAAFQVSQQLAKESGRSLRLIELGCGEGHVLAELLKLCVEDGLPVEECVGVDYQSDAIERARRFYPQANFVVADYANQRLNLKPFDVVLLVGTLHEVYSSCYSPTRGEIDHALGQRAVKKALRHNAQLVTEGGVVVLFDGVEHALPPESEITIKFSTPDALGEFRRMAAEYEAFRLRYEELAADCHVRISIHSFTRYITKTRFFNSSLWEIEKRESYQYFNESQFEECFGQLGLNVMKLQCHTPDRENWLERVSIETPGVDFPKENILIVGQKVSQARA
ncbi:MAG TPA: methyltransferase domain-containing protein [Pyrinomonadaceae bacterium]|jgi:SAM-dependent methyltransferase